MSEANCTRILEDAVVRLLKERPFYGHLLLGFRRRQVEGSALGVTIAGGVPTLCFDPRALAAFNPAERSALLEHVLKHVLHLHPLRGAGLNERTWDLACDLAINPTIENLPPQAAFPERLRLEAGLAAEEYHRLLSRPFDTGNLDGEGLGDADRDTGDHGGGGSEEELPASIDDHSAWPEAGSTPKGLAEEVVKTMVHDALRKAHGELPGEVRELVESMLTPSPIPWREVLRQFVATAGRVGQKSTWKRGHRRFGSQSPGIRKKHRLNLLVGVDVSDSTDTRELREAFASELVRIARGRQSRITVLYAGSRIQRIESFSSDSVVAEVYEGGGFTDLRPVFEYARTMQPPPAAVIYLTDGFGEAPEAMELPTLWVLTGEGEKPVDWGVEMRLDVAIPKA